MSHSQSTSRPPHSLCPICGGSASVPFFAKNGYAIVRCETCSILYVSPTPSDAELEAHYQNPAYYEGEEDQGYRSYADMKKALRPHFAHRLRVMDAHLPSRGRLLDFGCAAGYFLEMARADGWQIAGVELATDMARQASDRLGIQIAASLDALNGNDFDAITLWEVIEHLPRPMEQLRQLYERLRPGGLLMLSTPNNGHWQAVREPEAWTSYRPPSHLLYFSSRTLQDTLQRAGLERIEIHRVSPLPPLPGWMRRLSAPLQYQLVTGQAKAWPLALFAWRAIRVLGWAWQKVAHPHDDIFATLEAIAFRPA
jgi:SAM-dependent methyltransferase